MKTRQTHTLLILFLLLPLTQYAQREKSLWLDVNAGLNSIWIVNQNSYQNEELNYSSTFGLSGGLGVRYFASDLWGFGSTPGFIQLGQKYAAEFDGDNVTRSVKLSYIQVPLLAMVNMNSSTNPSWFCFGPNVLFLLSADQKFVNEGSNYHAYNPQNLNDGLITERFKPVDVMLDISFNKMYRLSSRELMFLLSFNTAFGLTDINSKDWQLPQVTGTKAGEYKGSHNFYLGISAGLMFDAFKNK
jgi:hypothetical protein